MTREEFDTLVQNVENGVGRNPAALRLRVAWLAALGYILLLAGMIIVVGIAGAFFSGIYWADVQGKILCGFLGVVILFGGGAAMLRALLVKVPPPKGIPISRAEAPALYEMLDDLRVRLNSVPFHHVQLLAVHNAGVVQVPRLGLLGWSKNYLLIGLPLLDGHSPDEIRAIMAHEFAHLSRQHGRFSHWIYRLRRSWESVFIQLSQANARQSSLRPFLIKCVDFFWPRFNAHAFVLSRANEYEADSVAAQLTTPDTMADALIRTSMQDLQLDQKFWPELWKFAATQAGPPPNTLARLRDCLHQSTSDESTRWLTESLRIGTTNADTHPCLTDRLRALGCLPRGISDNMAKFTAAPTPSAAEVFLGAALDKLRPQVEELWRKDVSEKWAARHAKAGALADRLSAVEQAVAAATDDVDGVWDKAVLTMELKGNDEAEPLLRRILATRPEHVPANFHLGRILLDRGNDAGLAHVERAILEEPNVTPQACGLLLEHYRRTGQSARMREVELRMDRYEKDLAASRIERQQVSANDRLIPHGLSHDELLPLLKVLSDERSLMRAELARKELRHFPKQKLFLLCIRGKRTWYGLHSSEQERTLVEGLTQKVQLPGRVLIFAPGTGHRALAQKLRKIDHALIFDRNVAGSLTSEVAADVRSRTALASD